MGVSELTPNYSLKKFTRGHSVLDADIAANMDIIDTEMAAINDKILFDKTGNYISPITDTDALKLPTAVFLKEISTPTAISDYGAIYTKSDNTLYFQDGAGVEKTVCCTDVNYAEMYLNNNSTATVLETADTPIMLRNFTTGSLEGWTFHNGSTGSITAFADYGATVPGTVLVTDASHNLSTGDIISIRGTTNYNGVFSITDVSENAFYITDTWVADDGASDWDQGDYVKAGVNAAGKYMSNFQLSSSEAAGAGSVITLETYINTVACTKCHASRKFANNDQGNIVGGSIITVAVDDRISFAMSSSGTNNVTNQYGNMRIHRL